VIKLFWCPRTRASRAVWLLEETGLPYEIVPVNVYDPTAKAANPAFLAASPLGKVPAIEDGPVAMADSAAIALYLADRYPQAKLAPAIDDPDRGRYLFWMTYSPGAIEPAMVERFYNIKPNHVTHGWGTFDAMIRTIADEVGDGPWLFGDRFTAADVMIGSAAAYMRVINMLPDDPVLQAYADRCIARPAYKRGEAKEVAQAKALGLT
jgi:glutathione S-transferase